MASDRSPDASLDQKRRSAYQQRGPPCACPRSHVLPLIAILSLGACGTTGTQVEPASEAGDATGPGTMQPPPEPEPPPPCIPIHESCVSAEDFQAETESLAAEYREHVNFENQWGLGHVKADYAYGHLSQIMGEDVAPGAGVTIGFIDSGIDQGHPDFDGKTITEWLLLRCTRTRQVTDSHTAQPWRAWPRPYDHAHEYLRARRGMGHRHRHVRHSHRPGGGSTLYPHIAAERLAEQGPGLARPCSTTCWCPGPWCRTSTS